MGRSDRLEAPFVTAIELARDLFHAGREYGFARVSITDQAGIGKTQLAWGSEDVDGVVEVWWQDGRSPAYGEGVTFWALGEMVRYRAGLLETDDPATTRTKVTEMVVTHVPDEEERRWIEPALFALLGVGEAPAGGRDELFRAGARPSDGLTGIVTPVRGPPGRRGLLDFIDTCSSGQWRRSRSRPWPPRAARPSSGLGRPAELPGPRTAPPRRRARAAGRPVPGLPRQCARSRPRRRHPRYAVGTIRMLSRRAPDRGRRPLSPSAAPVSCRPRALRP
jgi:hypothetical protein